MWTTWVVYVLRLAPYPSDHGIWVFINQVYFKNHVGMNVSFFFWFQLGIFAGEIPVWSMPTRFSEFQTTPILVVGTGLQIWSKQL